MTDNDDSFPAGRRWHIARLALFAAFLFGMFYLVAVTRVIDVEAVRGMVAATGPAAPLVYVVVSAGLGAVFVPGPLLAAGSGLLFGPLVGTFVTLGSAVGTAMISSFLGRRAGRESARGLLGAQRAERIDAQIERRGLWAVVGQRFLPGVSDALASYVFGAFGVPLWQMAVGAFIGSAPRAFVYTALGASIGDLSGPLAYTAIAVWCATAVIGAFAAHRGYRSWRGRGVRLEREAVPDRAAEPGS
ncbi:TVP38/TMEM64 family protein [Nocardia abscessus]|uniref:TVP38/TMEM64 family protein n=1 Tax=Nocardia abscessus TaxID=120957 RepID=UPI0024579B2C|nr:TVP38/TMEM64 family protein [Nocardia abscessus]